MQEAPFGERRTSHASDPQLQLLAPETPQTQWYSSVQTDLCIFPPKLLLLLGAFLSVRHHQPPRLRAQRSGGSRGQSAGEQTGQDSPFRGTQGLSQTERRQAMSRSGLR